MGNHIELFTHHLRLNCPNNQAYLNLMHDLLDVLSLTASGKAAFIGSGVLDILMEMALSIAGSLSSLVESVGFNGSNSQVLNERTSALIFLVDVWLQRPEYVQNRQNEGKMTEPILHALKQGCRDKSKAVSILSMNLMASLLDKFSRERNKYAPIILKALTFILIDLFLQSDLRDEMLNNFITLFKSQPTIPI